MPPAARCDNTVSDSALLMFMLLLRPTEVKVKKLPVVNAPRVSSSRRQRRQIQLQMRRNRRRSTTISAALALVIVLGLVGVFLRPGSNAEARTETGFGPDTKMKVAHNALIIDGLTRTWREEVPAGLSGPRPVVMVLHGGGLNGDEMSSGSSFTSYAARKGFVLVFPDGLYTGWDAGGCCTAPGVEHVADKEFLMALRGDLIKRGIADPDNFNVVGFSNGGMMALTLACEPAARVRTVVSVAGALVADCADEASVSAMFLHGTDDGMVPIAGYDGVIPSTSKPLHYPPLGLTVAQFAGRSGCDPTPTESQISGGAMSEVDYGGCGQGSQVKAILFEGGGHNWPGGSQPVGTKSYATFDAAAASIEFIAETAIGV